MENGWEIPDEHFVCVLVYLNAYKICFQQQTCQNMYGNKTHNIPDAYQASVYSHFDATDERFTVTELFTFSEHTPNGSTEMNE